MELLSRLHARKEKGKKKSVRKCEIVFPVPHPGGPWGTPSISQIKMQKEVHNWTKKLDGRSVQRERDVV